MGNIMTHAQIDQIIDDAINEINESFYLEIKISNSAESELLALIDSMQVVALLVTIEEKIEQIFMKQVPLVDDIDLLSAGGPLHTVGKLKEYLYNRIF
jgi:hypothetical protein